MVVLNHGSLSAFSGTHPSKLPASQFGVQLADGFCLFYLKVELLWLFRKPDLMWRLLGTCIAPSRPALLLIPQKNSGLPPSFLSTQGSHLFLPSEQIKRDVAEPANFQKPQSPCTVSFIPLAPPSFRRPPAFLICKYCWHLLNTFKTWPILDL